MHFECKRPEKITMSSRQIISVKRSIARTWTCNLHGTEIMARGTGFLQVNSDVNILKSVAQATNIAQIPGNLISKGLEGLFNVVMIAFPALETLLRLNENLWEVATDPSNWTNQVEIYQYMVQYPWIQKLKDRITPHVELYVLGKQECETKRRRRFVSCRL